MKWEEQGACCQGGRFLRECYSDIKPIPWSESWFLFLSCTQERRQDPVQMTHRQQTKPRCVQAPGGKCNHSVAHTMPLPACISPNLVLTAFLACVLLQLPFIGWIGPLRPLQKVLQTLTVPTASALFKRTGRQFFLADGTAASTAHQIPSPGWATTPSVFDSLPNSPTPASTSSEPAMSNAPETSNGGAAATHDAANPSASLPAGQPTGGSSSSSSAASPFSDILPDAAVWLALAVPSLAGAMNRMAGLATMAGNGTSSKEVLAAGSRASQAGGEQSDVAPSQPLLVQMTQDCPEQGQYFYSALKSFASRTCYANTGV